jgi:hypothetical protein
MRQRFGYELGWWGARLILLLAFMQAAPRIISAQNEPLDAGAAFAGGRMVRGTVTAVAADRLTVKTEEGDIYQVSVSANTRMMKDHQPVKIADIKAGDGVGAMGVMDAPAKTVHAVLVAVMDAAQMKKAREDLGKLYITGSVTSIDMDNARITVKRPDGVSQTIQADEGTSFKRGGRGAQMAMNGNTAPANASNGGESITLADVKTGDMVMGRGAVKNGIFVPAELRVMNATARGPGQRRGARNGASAVLPNTNHSESPQ